MRILCTSPWVPVEWIAAHGLSFCGIWSTEAEAPISTIREGECAFARATISFASPPPATAVILTTACDQMRRAADFIAEPGDRSRDHPNGKHSAPNTRLSSSFLFNLPATWQTDAPRRLYHAELDRLSRFLVLLGGQAPTEACLSTIIDQFEVRRSHIRTLVEPGSASRFAEAMLQLFSNDSAPSKPDIGLNALKGIPLALVGGPLLRSRWSLFETIERAGACVVLNAAEPGERCLLPPLPKPARLDSSLTALADHYFNNIVDVFSRPNSRLYSWLAMRLKQRKVRGIVLWIQVGCDLWRAEAASLSEAFRLPVLTLDSQAFQGTYDREANRLSAFVESLQ